MICTFLHSWAPALLLIGLGTRFSAVALFIMTLVIQIFVYPDAYPTHGVWAAVLLYLIVNWPGKIDVLFSQLTIPHARYQKNAFFTGYYIGAHSLVCCVSVNLPSSGRNEARIRCLCRLFIDQPMGHPVSAITWKSIRSPIQMTCRQKLGQMNAE